MPRKTATKEPKVEDCSTCVSLEKRVKGLEDREVALRVEINELHNVEQPIVNSTENIRKQSAANLNPIMYVVGPDESFAIIASRELGNAGHWKSIALLNPELNIATGGLPLPAGAEIKLPR